MKRCLGCIHSELRGRVQLLCSEPQPLKKDCQVWVARHALCTSVDKCGCSRSKKVVIETFFGTLPEQFKYVSAPVAQVQCCHTDGHESVGCCLPMPGQCLFGPIVVPHDVKWVAGTMHIPWGAQVACFWAKQAAKLSAGFPSAADLCWGDYLRETGMLLHCGSQQTPTSEVGLQLATKHTWYQRLQ